MATRPTLLSRVEIVKSAGPTPMNTAGLSQALGSIQSEMQKDFDAKNEAQQTQDASDRFKLAMEVAGGDIMKAAENLPKKKVRMLNHKAAQTYNNQIRNLTMVQLYGLAQRHSEVLAEEARHQGKDKKDLDPDYHRENFNAYISAQINELKKDPTFADVTPMYQEAVRQLGEVEYKKLTDKKLELVHSEHLTKLDDLQFNFTKLAFDKLRKPIEVAKGQTFEQAVAQRAALVKSTQKALREFTDANYGELKSAEDKRDLWERTHDEVTDNFFMSLYDQYQFFGNPAAYTEAIKYYSTGETYYINKQAPAWLSGGSGGPEWEDVWERFYVDANTAGNWNKQVDEEGRTYVSYGNMTPNAAGAVQPAKMYEVDSYLYDDKGRPILKSDGQPITVRSYVAPELIAHAKTFVGTKHERQANEALNAVVLLGALKSVAYDGTKSQWDAVYTLVTNADGKHNQLGVSNAKLKDLREIARGIEKSRNEKVLYGPNPVNAVAAVGKEKNRLPSQVMSSVDITSRRSKKAAVSALVDSGAFSTAEADKLVNSPQYGPTLIRSAALLEKVREDRRRVTRMREGEDPVRNAHHPVGLFSDDDAVDLVERASIDAQKASEVASAVRFVAESEGVSVEDAWAEIEGSLIRKGSYVDKSLPIRFIAYAPEHVAGHLLAAYKYKASDDVVEAIKLEASTTIPDYASKFAALHTTTGGAMEATTLLVLRNQLAEKFFGDQLAKSEGGGGTKDLAKAAVTAADSVLREYAEHMDANSVRWDNHQVTLLPKLKSKITGAEKPLPPHAIDTINNALRQIVPGQSNSFFEVLGGQFTTSSVRPVYSVKSREGQDSILEVRFVVETDGLPVNLTWAGHNLKFNSALNNDRLIREKLGITAATVVEPQSGRDEVVLLVDLYSSDIQPDLGGRPADGSSMSSERVVDESLQSKMPLETDAKQPLEVKELDAKGSIESGGRIEPLLDSTSGSVSIDLNPKRLP